MTLLGSLRAQGTKVPIHPSPAALALGHAKVPGEAGISQSLKSLGLRGCVDGDECSGEVPLMPQIPVFMPAASLTAGQYVVSVPPRVWKQALRFLIIK